LIWRRPAAPGCAALAIAAGLIWRRPAAPGCAALAIAAGLMDCEHDVTLAKRASAAFRNNHFALS
jgi:hypothetical protein